MDMDGPAIGDDEALGPQRLQPDVVASGSDGAFDLGVQQPLERREQHALKLDGKRQEPIEERGDRRELVLYPGGIRQRQAGGVLEPPERATVDLPPPQQQIKLPPRVPRRMTFQITPIYG